MAIAQRSQVARVSTFKNARSDRAARIERRRRVLRYGVVLFCFALVVLLNVWCVAGGQPGLCASATPRATRLEQEQRELRV